MWGGSHSAISAEDLKALFFFSLYTVSLTLCISLSLFLCVSIFFSLFSPSIFRPGQTKWRQQQNKKLSDSPATKPLCLVLLWLDVLLISAHMHIHFLTVFNIFCRGVLCRQLSTQHRAHIKKTQHRITFTPYYINLSLHSHSSCPSRPQQPCRRVCSSSLKPFLLLAYVPEGTLCQ